MMSGRLDRKTILLLGTGRSGTSWLASMLARPFRYRLLFEPFQPHQVPGAECVADRFYGVDRLPDAVRAFCRRALNDELRSDWIAQGSSKRFGMHRWRFWPLVRVCKAVRGNLFVPSFRTILGSHVPIIVLVRQPGAVVESFLRVSFPWATEVSTLLAQSKLQEAYGVPLDALAPLARDPASKLAVRWVIENGYLLQHGAELGVRIVHYEELVRDPAREIGRLCRSLGIRIARDLEEVVDQPSHTSHRRGEFGQARTEVSWRERLSADHAARVEEVLEVAGIAYPTLERKP